MTAPQHTPGPWHAVPYGDGWDTVICEDEAGHQRIAFMAIPGSRDDRLRRKRWLEIRANAQLIAAAPELLEAAAEFLDFFENNPDDLAIGEEIRLQEKLRAAIAKARGGAA